MLNALKDYWRRRRLPRGVRKRRARFDRDRRRHTRRLNNVALSVLVWGPGPSRETPIARKRLDIRKELSRKGHDAVFSEALEPSAGEQDSELALSTRELSQAMATDVIILLIEGSPGALGELHDFFGKERLAPKVFVMAPDKYRDGYSGKGLLKLLDDGYGAVYWYQPQEVESCYVLSKAVNRVEARRQLRFSERG